MNIDISKKYCWSKEYQLKYYNKDFQQVLKPSALMNFLQDMATVNAEVLGFGYSFTYPKNYAWFLIKYHMEFDDFPEKIDSIMIKTEARGISKVIAHRDFEIWAPDNKTRFGRIISNWVMVDIKNRNILPLRKIVDFMPDFVKRDSDLNFDRLRPPKSFDLEKVFEIRYDDIDINQHVNNTIYLVWAFELLPWGYRASHKLKQLDIVFKKEIKYGNNILSLVKVDGLETTHLLKNAANGEEICFLKAIWEEQ